MGAHLFIQTLNRIAAHRGGNRARAVGRHLMWQVRRHLNHFPYQIRISDKSTLTITDPDAANGCAALAWSLGCYDFDNMAFLQDILVRNEEPLIVFDIGANMGIYTLLASEHDKTRVFSFEPHPITTRILRNNISKNHRNNVTVVPCAVSSRPGELTFSNLPGSSLNQIIPVRAAASSSQTITVPAIRIDDYCRSENIRPDIVKIDVEGHEGEVLVGFGPYLQDVEILFIEANLSLEALQAHLPRERFAHFFIDFKSRRLTHSSNSHDQDLVFINHRFLPALVSIGYAVEP